jgi:hypothetical protein
VVTGNVARSSGKPQVSWFGRDPAAFVTLLSGAVVALMALLPGIPDGLAAAIGGVVTAGGGVVIAFVVVREGHVAVIVGLAKAVFVVVIILGHDIPPATQASILLAIEAVGAVIVAKRVTAPVDLDGYRRDKATGLSQAEATTLKQVA